MTVQPDKEINTLPQKKKKEEKKKKKKKKEARISCSDLTRKQLLSKELIRSESFQITMKQNINSKIKGVSEIVNPKNKQEVKFKQIWIFSA